MIAIRIEGQSQGGQRLGADNRRVLTVGVGVGLACTLVCRVALL